MLAMILQDTGGATEPVPLKRSELGGREACCAGHGDVEHCGQADPHARVGQRFDRAVLGNVRSVGGVCELAARHGVAAAAGAPATAFGWKERAAARSYCGGGGAGRGRVRKDQAG